MKDAPQQASPQETRQLNICRVFICVGLVEVLDLEAAGFPEQAFAQFHEGVVVVVVRVHAAVAPRLASAG